MRILIHIGVHKTATTLLQKSLQQNRKKLVDNSVSVVVRDTHKLLKNQLRLFLNNKSNIAETQKVIKNFISAEKEKGIGTIVISDENLLDAPPSRYFEKKQKLEFYPNAKRNVKKLKKLFKSHELVWLLYTRKQHSLIPSLYKDGLKYFRYSSTLTSFLNGLDKKMFRFDILIQKLAETVKGDRVIIKNFESIENGTEKYIKDFFACFIKLQDFSIPVQKINVSLTTFQAELFRLYSKNELSITEKNKIRIWIGNAPQIDSFPCDSNYKLNKRQMSKLKEIFANDISYKP